MSKEDQNYEDYWKYTAAITKIESYDEVLLIIIKEIDKGLENSLDYSKVYENIENKIINLKKFKGKDPNASARKYVNQFVKLGFIKTGLRSYHKDTETFINTKGDSKRKLLSNIKPNLSSELKYKLVEKKEYLLAKDIIHKALLRNNVEHSFIFSGGSIMPVIDKLYKSNIN